jgi:hypothetical protein
MAVQGPIPVAFGDVFPEGAYEMDVQPVRDFEKSSQERFVQATDKHSGELLWLVDVIDADPSARDKTVKVKIAAPHQPVPPEGQAGVPFRPVEFDGLTVTPYVNSNSGRLAYSLRAKAMRAPSKGASANGAAAKASGEDAGQAPSQSSSASSGSSKSAA